MPNPPHGLDPEVLTDLICVDDASRLFAALKKPILFWEGLYLSRVDRKPFREEVARLKQLVDAGRPAEIARPILDRLEGLRVQLGPFMVKLQKFLAGVPGMPADPDQQDLLLAFIAISTKGRESAHQWLAAPSTSVAAAAQQVKAIGAVVERYRVALRKERPIAAPVPTQPPAAPPVASQPASPAIELPAGVNPDILEEVRRNQRCRDMCRAAGQEVELWQVFCLVTDDEAVKPVIDGLLGSGSDGLDGMQALVDKLRKTRETHGEMVGRLREYMGTLHMPRFGPEVMDLVMGFVVGSPRGRENVDRWIKEPDRYRVEASERIETVISRTLKYQNALRMTQT